MKGNGGISIPIKEAEQGKALIVFIAVWISIPIKEAELDNLDYIK